MEHPLKKLFSHLCYSSCVTKKPQRRSRVTKLQIHSFASDSYKNHLFIPVICSQLERIHLLVRLSTSPQSYWRRNLPVRGKHLVTIWFTSVKRVGWLFHGILCRQLVLFLQFGSLGVRLHYLPAGCRATTIQSGVSVWFLNAKPGRLITKYQIIYLKIFLSTKYLQMDNLSWHENIRIKCSRLTLFFFFQTKHFCESIF